MPPPRLVCELERNDPGPLFEAGARGDAYASWDLLRSAAETSLMAQDQRRRDY